MARITDLSEDYSLDAAALASRGVRTVDDLWACISRNVDHGVKRVAKETGINREVLLAFLIADALDDPKRSYTPRPFGLWMGVKPVWVASKTLGNSIKQRARNRAVIWSTIKKHRLGFNLFWLTPKWLRGREQRLWGTRGTLWPDLLLLALPVLILGLGLRAQYLNQRVVHRVAVNSGVALPAFAVIDTNKLTTRAVMDQPGSFASIDDLNFRYPLTDLAPGEVIKDEQLVPATLSGSLAGRRTLSLPVRNSSSVESARTMDHLKLIFAPRDKEKSGIAIDDVIFLSRKKEGETTFVLVAIPETKAMQVEGLLGTCDVFVSQTLS
jgi:hypothetical protein